MKGFRILLLLAAVALITTGIVMQGAGFSTTGINWNTLAHEMVTDEIPSEIHSITIEAAQRHVYVHHDPSQAYSTLNYATSELAPVVSTRTPTQLHIVETVHEWATFWRRTFYDDYFDIITLVIGQAGLDELVIRTTGGDVHVTDGSLTTLDIAMTDGEVWIDDAIVGQLTIEGEELNASINTIHVNDQLNVHFHEGHLTVKASDVMNLQAEVDVGTVTLTDSEVHLAEITIGDGTMELWDSYIHQSITVNVSTGNIFTEFENSLLTLASMNLQVEDGWVRFNQFTAPGWFHTDEEGWVDVVLHTEIGEIVVETGQRIVH